MLRSTRLFTIATSLAAVALSIAVAAPSASAAVPAGATGTSGQVPAGAVSAPMTAVGYRSISPNGTVVLKNGVTLTVPATVAQQLIAARGESGAGADSPDNVVAGNCGHSYLYLSPNSNDSGAIVQTGWTVIASVVGSVYDFSWYFTGTNETFNRPFEETYGNIYSSYSWSNPYYEAEKGTGVYTADVQIPESYVIGTKTTCYSGGPSDITNV